jgi:glycosyltransferase involved in cell wall biosynthesis
MTPFTGEGLRFAVIHLGPRLHYGVPAVLAQAGMLHSLYTDCHAECGGARWLNRLPTRCLPKRLQRLMARRLPLVIGRERVRSWIYPNLQQEWFNRAHVSRRKLAQFCFEKRVGGHWLAERAIRDDFGGASALYVHPCVSTKAIREAKRRGMFVVLEAISYPFNMRVQKAEYDRLGLKPTEGMDCIEENITFFRKEAVLADMVLAASEYVKKGLVELGIEPERIALVPYGLDAGFFVEESKPVLGRILFVGTIDPHKGVAYYARAARELKAAGFSGEFRTIGPFSAPDMPRDPAFEGLNYVGQVPRSEVKREFANADIFVFPTLSDGFGMVLLEALFAGLPIVCTPNCGDVVRDGFNGRVVPSHNATALAAAIREIVGNRELREHMSRNATARKTEFTLETYQKRLIEAVREHAARRRG